MLRTLLLVTLVACGGKPAARAPSNASTGAETPPAVVAPSGDSCTAQATCTGCLSSASPDPEKGSCQWDTGKQTCQVACDPATRNCVQVGSRTLEPADVAEVCANAKPVAP